MFGEWVKAQRLKRGWSQAKLGEEAGTSKDYIRHLEAGRAEAGGKTLRGLARAFGVSLDWMLSEGGLLPGPIAALQDEGVPPAAIQELLNAWATLEDDDRQLALDLIRSLHDRRKAKDAAHARSQQHQAHPAPNGA